MRKPLLSMAAALTAASGLPAAEIGCHPPERVSVLPVFLVPRGARTPTEAEGKLLMRHLELARRRYRQLLDVTFPLAKETPDVVRARLPLEEYRRLPKAEPAGRWAAELFEHYKCDRFTCPYIFVAVVANPAGNWPPGGGRPINGGLNRGGGILVMSTFGLTKMPNFQSTLQHELGHAFGLPHVDVYGYSMKANPSMMSYNPAHRTNGLRPARVPGVFIPEDYRGLAMNNRVFPEFKFDARRHLPRGYRMSKKVITLGPMKLRGGPDYEPRAATASGEAFGSSVSHIVAGKQVTPSAGPGVTFNPKAMWHSARSRTGWVDVTVKFPRPVRLTAVAVHSQHSGKSHAAQAVRVRTASKVIVIKRLNSVDDVVRFRPAAADTWRFDFRAGPSGQVVLRGLRFFDGAEELFAPRVPYRREGR